MGGAVGPETGARVEAHPFINGGAQEAELAAFAVRLVGLQPEGEAACREAEAPARELPPYGGGQCLGPATVEGAEPLQPVLVPVLA